MEKIAVDVAVGVFSGLVTSLIDSYSKELSREGGGDLSDYQADRSIAQKLSDKISSTCRKLPSKECELIAIFLGNEITVSALTQLIREGAFDAAQIATIFGADPASQKLSSPALLALSETVQNTFDECIAEEEFASHYSTLRQIRLVRNQTSEVLGATGRIESTLQDAVIPKIDSMAKQMDVLTKSILSPATPPTTSSIDVFVHSTSRQLSYQDLTERLESQYNTRIESANAAVNKGQTSLARDQFHALYKEVEHLEDTSSLKVRLRAANGIALCHWYVTENDDAKAWFQTAISIGGDEKLVRRNRMLVRFLERDKKGASVLAEALLLDYPHNFDGASILANLAMAAGQQEEALLHYEKHSDGSLIYLLALAGQNLRLERFEAAQKYAEEALRLSPESQDAKLALADSKALPVVKRRNEIQSDRSLSPVERHTLEEAIPVYAECLSDLNRPQSAQAWQRLVVNYSSFTSVLNRLEEAWAVLRTFLQVHPMSIDALRNAFIVSVKAKEFDRAIAEAELILKLEHSFENAARLLETLSQAERNSRAIEMYERLVREIPELAKSGRILSAIGRCLYHTGETEKAFAMLNVACAALPVWPPALLVRAASLEMEGSVADAEADLKKSCQESEASWNWLSNYEYGVFLARNARWPEALERFEYCGGKDADSSILPEYLVVLSQLSRWRDCIEALDRRSNPEVFNETLTDLEANCRIRIYDFKGAEACLRTLTDRRGTNPYHWSNLANVLYRQDKIDAAISTLRQAIKIHDAASDLWINLSRMCLVRGHKKEAIQAATRAANLTPNSESVHKWIFAIGQLALRGEELPQSFLPLLQRAFDYLIKSPGSGLTQIKIDKQFKEVKKALRRMHRSVRRTAQIYNSSPAPLHILRSALSRSLFEIWLLAVGGTANLSIRLSRGRQEDQAAETGSVSSDSKVVVELTALLSLSLCQKLELLPKLFKRVLIPTTVFDEVKQAAEAMVFETNTAGVLALEEGRPLYVEQHPATRANQHAVLNRILEFCKSPLVELLHLPAEALDDGNFEDRAENLGLQGAHAGALAAHHQGVLYSDDWLYRTLFVTEEKVSGTCTQAILRVAQMKGELSSGDYQRAILLLIGCNYAFVSDDVGTLWALIENGYGPDHALSRKILGRFASGEVTRMTSAGFLGQFLGSVRRLSSPVDRAAWMKAIVESFMGGRPLVSEATPFCLGMMMSLSNLPELFFDILLTLSRDKSVDPALPFALHAGARGFIKEMGLLSRGIPGLQVNTGDWRAAWRMYLRIRKVRLAIP